MRYTSIYLIFVTLFAVVGCHKTTDNVVLYRYYFPANSYIGVAGRKLLSLEQVTDYVEQSGINYSSHFQDIFTNRASSQFYFYITTDAELVAIKHLRLHSVQAALLNTNVPPGIRLYMIEGNPNSHIKPTAEWTQANGGK